MHGTEEKFASADEVLDIFNQISSSLEQVITNLNSKIFLYVENAEPLLLKPIKVSSDYLI